MGSSYSLESNQDSSTEPGKKVIVASRLPETSPEDMIESIFMVLRSPVSEFVKPALKTVEVEEHDSDSFTVKVILDGLIVQKGGFGDGTYRDLVWVWMKVNYYPEQELVETENYLGELGAWINKANKDTVYLKSFTRLLKDPMRLEYYCEAEGQRLVDDKIKDAFEGYLRPTLELAKKRRVRFVADSDSLYEPGKKSVISEPLASSLTYDTLWSGLMDHAATYPEMEITEMSDTEVFVGGEGGVELPAGAWRVEWFQDEGKVVRTKQLKGKIIEVQTQVLHRDPLRIEVWKELPDGTRDTSKSYGRLMATAIDTLVDSNKSWWSWLYSWVL